MTSMSPPEQKFPPRPVEHANADIGVLVETREGMDRLVEHLEIDGVQHAGPVQAQSRASSPWLPQR